MTRLRLPAALFAFALVLGAAPASAQMPGRPDDPDLPLDAATRRAVIDTLADRMERHYVFPDKGREVARDLQKRLKARQYDGIAGSKEFADSLTAHVRAITKDLHLRVNYRHEPLPPMHDDSEPASERDRMRTMDRRVNYGFERVERLPGNVGYLDLRQFSGNPDAQAVATAAMNFLGGADAMIVDLRRNGGGSPEMIATLLTYFVEPGDRLMFNTFYEREGDRTTQWWTSPNVPGPRLAGRPVYVLIGPLTGSAAEEFAYDIQTHKLGVTVGAVTWGGAHPGGMFRLSDHFAAFIATGRAINPITNTNWEGVGIQPDVAVKPEEALRVAYVAAIEKLIEASKSDPDRVAALNRALGVAKQRPDEKPEDFARQRPRPPGS
jgi:retinol-binding protein 3